MQRIAALVGILALVLLFAIAFWFRVAHLQKVPGINGDEAWYGVQAANLLAGRPLAWWTPTGLPLNPFFTSIEVLLLAIFKPAFWILRAPAVISGVLTVVLTYVLGARALDRIAALIATILMATLPIAIGYSRFGWDPSQTPLFSLLALSFALRGHALGTALSFLLCLVVHASNVFLLPALALPFLTTTVRRCPGWPARGWGWLLGTAAAAVAIILAFTHLFPHVIRIDPARLLDAPALAIFLGHYGRLISGITLYEYVVGPVSPPLARCHDWAFWILLLILLDVGLRRLAWQGQWERVALVVGLGASALGLYVIAGPEVIRPHIERYGMFLVTPTVLVLACLVRSLMPESTTACFSASGRRWLAGVTAVGWTLLLVFHQNYFEPIRRTGGQSHRTFRTAGTEPKQRAFAGIVHELERTGGGREGRIVTEDWWLHHPLKFLASSRKTIKIICAHTDFDPDLKALRYFLHAELRCGAYVVGFVGGPAERVILAGTPAGVLRRWVIPDNSGRGLITVYHLEGEMLGQRVDPHAWR